MTRQDETAQDEALIAALGRLPEPVVPEGLAARIIARTTAPANNLAIQPSAPPARQGSAIQSVPATLQKPVSMPPLRRHAGRWALMAASIAGIILVAGAVALNRSPDRADSDGSAAMALTAPPQSAAPATDASSPADRNARPPLQHGRPLDQPAALARQAETGAQSPAGAEQHGQEAPVTGETRLAGEDSSDGLPPPLAPEAAPGAERVVTAQAGPPAPGPEALPRAKGVYGPPAPTGFSIAGGGNSGIGGGGGGGGGVGQASPPPAGAPPPGGARPGSPGPNPGSF